MRSVAGRLRLDLAQFRELAAFAQFGSDLDKATQMMLAKGARLTEVLKQDQYAPLSVEKQTVLIFAATAGHLDAYPVGECRRYEGELLAYVETRHPQLLAEIGERKVLTDDLRERLTGALGEFAQVFVAKAES